MTIGDRIYFDPLEIRDAKRAADRLESAKAMTFEQCARAYLDDHRESWRNPKHRQQWEIATYVYPVFGDLPVQMIDRQLVLKALKPIWKTKPETANRVRGRIETVLDWATAGDLRKGDNPARWHGNIANALPKRSKVRKVKHHPALAFAELPAFMAALRAQEGIAARALEFTILTAARTGETIGATPAEIDPNAKVWTVPADRIKAQREHRVPLATRALAILEEMPRGAQYALPGARRGKPLSNMAMLAVLERMGRADVTVHGFRSTFKDWASERTNFPREVSEKRGPSSAHRSRRAAMSSRSEPGTSPWVARCRALKTPQLQQHRNRMGGRTSPEQRPRREGFRKKEGCSAKPLC